MDSSLLTPATLSKAWEVLVLFLIPIGGGIPAGVLMARSKGFDWPVMMVLYLISDIILACVFEPILLLILVAAKKSPAVLKIKDAFKKSTEKMTAHYGTHLGPFALILVAFGADPMTGRTVAVASGHGFVTGWILAITGDMFYFTVLMVCTLWLSHILGDGTAATLIILVLMILIPLLVRKLRGQKSKAM